MDNVVCKVCGLSKYYYDNQILKSTSFEIVRGEICCLVGENGAGKTTLAQIIAGDISFEEGDVLIDGQSIRSKKCKELLRRKVKLVHQNYNSTLNQNMTVCDNLFINNEILYSKLPVIDYKKTKYEAEKLFASLGFENIDVGRKISELKESEKQICEIARAFAAAPELLILDEPTQSLSREQAENIYRLCHELKSKGTSIIYITHNTLEIKKLSDRLIILRSGVLIKDMSYKNISDQEELYNFMAGIDRKNRYPKTKANKGQVQLHVSNITNIKETVKDVSFDIKAGEIVGLAGLEGAGKTSLANLLFGKEKLSSGSINIASNKVKISNPYDAIKCGVALVGDNVNQSIVWSQNTVENLTLTLLENQPGILWPKNLYEKYTRMLMKDLKLAVHKLYFRVKGLSAGTLQKISIGKWLLLNSLIYIFDDPTKCLDISSKLDFYNIINQMAISGKSILFISSDFQELTGMCDRILIMKEGRIISELSSEEASSLKIVKSVLG